MWGKFSPFFEPLDSEQQMKSVREVSADLCLQFAACLRHIFLILRKQTITDTTAVFKRDFLIHTRSGFIINILVKEDESFMEISVSFSPF